MHSLYIHPASACVVHLISALNVGLVSALLCVISCEFREPPCWFARSDLGIECSISMYLFVSDVRKGSYFGVL